MAGHDQKSPWRSPPVLVPKPDGSVRFSIDFRRLNTVSIFNAYPMPHIDTLIHRMADAKFLSTLDLTKGYWQIPLDAKAKEKTASATPSGLYHFTRMPFGLHGAAASFQWLMGRTLKELYRTLLLHTLTASWSVAQPGKSTWPTYGGPHSS